MSTLNEARQALIDAIVESVKADIPGAAKSYAQTLATLQYMNEPEIPDPPVVDARDPDGKVLAWVNEIRAEYELGEPLGALPPNAPNTGYADITRVCPIGKALKPCGMTGFALDDGTRVVFPEFVFEFIRRHDTDRFGTRV